MNNPFDTAFGQVIRSHRERANLTQAELAIAAKISASYIQRIEYGHRTPTITVFLQLAGALNIEPTELLQETLRLQTILDDNSL